MTASPSNPAAGLTVTYTATVSSTYAPQSTTGGITVPDTVTFSSYSTACANVPLIAVFTLNEPVAYQATCTQTYTTAGPEFMWATFSGDSSNAASQDLAEVNVAKAPTTTTVKASPASPVPVGQQVTYTATVDTGGSGLAPTGTVTFTGGTTTLCANAALTTTAPYTATCAHTYTATGIEDVSAAYSGDTGTAPSTGTVAVTVGQAPAVTSAASALLTVGQNGSFTVKTTGFPAPSLKESGTLPGGVTFTGNGDGTATLAGTPAAGTGGAYRLTITASNGVSPDATQSFTLYIDSCDLSQLSQGSSVAGCSLAGADLTGRNLTGANLRGDDLTGADLAGANLSGANLNKDNLTGANLTGAEVSTTNFNHVTWSGTTCPDGTNSDADGGTCTGHL